MSLSSSEQPELPLDEELVAYLDGELDASASESVERRVQQDEHVRRELQQFDRVWNALDRLPRPAVSEAFTRTTIEMVASEAGQELASATAMLPIRKRKWRLQVAAISAAGLLLGFALLWLLLPDPNRMLYRNLGVIEQIDPLGEFRDVEFLRQLHASAGDWLQEEWGEKTSQRATTLASLNEASLAERKEYVAGLESEAKTALVGKMRRYEELSGPARRELAARYEAIVADPHARELHQTMLAYYEWLSEFPEVEQARLRLLDTPERVAEVVAMQERRQEREGLRLSSASALALRESLLQLRSDREIQQLQRKFAASLIDAARDPQRRDFGHDRFRSGDVGRMLFVVQHIARRDGGISPEGAAYFAAVESRLLAGIDPDTARQFRSKSLEDRAFQLQRWIGRSRSREKPDVATLEAYFLSEKFTPEEQYRLLSMPNDQMYKELERQYIDEFLGGGPRGQRGRRFGEWRGREGPPSGRGGPNGRGELDGRGESNSRGERGRGRPEVPPIPSDPTRDDP